MVDKKGLKVVKRNEVILIILALGIIAFVFATGIAVYEDTPIKGGNYSGNLKLLNISTELNTTVALGGHNVTCYYNVSGGNAYFNSTFNNLTGTIENAGDLNNDTTITIDTVNLLGGLLDSSTYNITCVVANSSDQTNISIGNITIDNTSPRVTNFTNVMNGGYYNGTIILNISVNDSSWVGSVTKGWLDAMRGVGSVYFNITNSTEDMVNFTRAFNHTDMWATSYWNVSINTSGFQDGIYNVTVWANETTGEATFTVNENNTEHIQITIDNTAPSLTYTCSPSSVIVGQIVTCTCTGTDGLGGGVNHTTDTTTSSSSSQIVTELTTTIAGTLTRTCTVKDRVGKIASTTASYTVTSAGGGGGSSSGGVSSTSGATISEASSVVLSGFEEETGVEQIEVTVSAAVSNVKITVTRYESQPEEVSVAKSGKVYKYVQVEAQNFADKLESAIITIKVEKDWISSQGFAKERLSMFKYDENSANKWDELITIFKEEDAGYYYYDVELDSFSYFAVSESATVESGLEEPEGIESSFWDKLPLWLWIVIGVVVVAGLIGGGIATKKKK